MSANNDKLREAATRALGCLKIHYDCGLTGALRIETIGAMDDLREALAASKPDPLEYTEELSRVLWRDFNRPEPQEHTPGCDALGGYGHGVGPCTCTPEPQAQAAEPEVVKFCVVLPEPPKATKFRRQQRRDGGYDMVPAYTEEELYVYGEMCVADFQQQLDAMRHARDLYKSEADSIEAMRREAIAKKDAALDADIANLQAIKKTLKRENEKPNGAITDTIWHTPYETLFDFVDAAITQAQECRK